MADSDAPVGFGVRLRPRSWWRPRVGYFYHVVYMTVSDFLILRWGLIIDTCLYLLLNSQPVVHYKKSYIRICARASYAIFRNTAGSSVG
jgi:hypothetical protein